MEMELFIDVETWDLECLNGLCLYAWGLGTWIGGMDGWVGWLCLKAHNRIFYHGYPERHDNLGWWDPISSIDKISISSCKIGGKSQDSILKKKLHTYVYLDGFSLSSVLF